MLGNLFKIRPYKTVECGSFIVKFYCKAKSYVEIAAASGEWSMRVASNTPAYDRLLDAAIRSETETIHNYAGSLFILTQASVSDRQLGADVADALDRWHERQSPPTEHKEPRRHKEPKRRFNELKS